MEGVFVYEQFGYLVMPFYGGGDLAAWLEANPATARSPDQCKQIARDLVNAVTAGFPLDRLALHMCRGNWTADEGKALSGDYRPLIDTLAAMQVGTLLLELCTPRAGEMEILKALPEHLRIGVGACNQKHAHVESVASIVAHAEQAISLFGAERLLLTPDCGFATFADNPVSSAATAQAKLAALAQATQILRDRHRLG